MIGLLGAIPEEIGLLVAAMDDGHTVQVSGMRSYHIGQLWGRPVVAVFSRIGKVAAASTVTHLISDFKVDQIVFTGVAGGVDSSLNIGDIVVASDLYQHDMDARPLFNRHEIPLLGRSHFSSTETLRQRCLAAAKGFLVEDLPKVVSQQTLSQFGIRSPKVVQGAIASGDKFFASREESTELTARLPVACVEMEGAAVAQVCHEYGIEYAVIRTISDAANTTAPIDFAKFIQEIASLYSYGIVKRLIMSTQVV